MADIYACAAFGNDTNGGTTEATPVATIQKGVDLLGQGDTLWLSDAGTFTPTAKTSYTTYNTGGTAAITIRSYHETDTGTGADNTITLSDGTTVPCALIDLNGGAGEYALGGNSAPDGSVFYRIKITGEATSTYQEWIEDYGTMVECELEEWVGSNDNSLYIDIGASALNCYIHDGNSASTTLGTRAIRSGIAPTIFWCHITNLQQTTTATAIRFDSTSSFAAYNLLRDVKTGFYVGDLNTVVNNTIAGEGNGGGRFIDSISTHELATITNNLAAFDGTSSYLYDMVGSPNHACIVLGPTRTYGSYTEFENETPVVSFDRTAGDITDTENPFVAANNYVLSTSTDDWEVSHYPDFIGTETLNYTPMGIGAGDPQVFTPETTEIFFRG